MNRIVSIRSQRLPARNAPRGSGRVVRARSLRPLILCALALVICASVGNGHWLETRITLPDSLGGALYPTCLATDTSERYVYIGDHGYDDCVAGGGVYVVDAESRTRVAKVPYGFISAVCTNTRRNKVYAADSAGDRVIVVSCATNQVVATVPTGANPIALCHNSTDDKMYAADRGGHDVTVIDCGTDTVIKTILFGESPTVLCYNPASNRVFCETDDSLVVIDGTSDSVVAVYAETWLSGAMVVNAVANRVYVSSLSGGVLVLDGESGDALDSLYGADVMCINLRTQKLYAGASDVRDFYAYDCTADTLIRRSHLRGEMDIYSMACDTTTGKVYATCVLNQEDVLIVIDGVTDTIAAKMPGPRAGRLLANGRGRMYSLDCWGPDLAVYDTGTDSLLRTVMIGGWSRAMCYDSIDDKVFYANYAILGEVGSIDAATNRPAGMVQVGQYPKHVIWHAPTNRVYCGSHSGITIIDPAVDTVTKVLPVRGLMLCSAPRVNKVYAFDPWNDVVAVIDCRNDSVVKTIPITMDQIESMCYVSTALYDKLYVSGWGGVSIIDCVNDSLIRGYAWTWARLAVGRDSKQVYCWRMGSLSTFDTAGDTLVAEVPWDDGGSGFALLYVRAVNKVYCAAPSGGPNQSGCILIADGTTDSTIAQIPLRIPTSLCYDSVGGLVYAACGMATDSVITFIDSRTDSIVGSLNSQVCPAMFTMVSAHRRLYVGPAGFSILNNSTMPVIRTDPPGVAEGTLPALQKEIPGPTMLSRNFCLVVLQPSVLLDAAGRKILDLHCGANDVHALVPGVYFVREPQASSLKHQAIRKVVVAR
jgi:YVTN family beta-propeller protein